MIFVTLLSLPPSATARHSLGQLCAITPFTIYIAKQINQMLKPGNTKEEILQRIADYLNVFEIMMKHIEIPSFNAITKRSPWKKANKRLIDVFTELDLYDLFDGLLSRGMTLESLLPQGKTLTVFARKPGVNNWRWPILQRR